MNQRPNESIPPASEVSGLEDVLRPRISPRARRLRAGSVAVALVLVVAFLLRSQIGAYLPYLIGDHTGASNSTTGNDVITVATGTGNPTPTPNVVALSTNITNGLFFNNQPIMIAQQEEIILHMQAGTNTLALNAPPFLPMSCTFTWPPQQGNGNCMSNGSINTGNSSATFDILNFLVSSNDLPQKLQTSLEDTMRQVILGSIADTHIALSTGEYYLTGFDAHNLPKSQAAPFPLVAQPTVTFLPTKDPYVAGCQDFICPSPSITPGSVNSQTSVYLAATLAYGWRFNTPDGHLFQQNTPLTPQSTSGWFDFSDTLPLALTYASDHGWTATLGYPLQAGESAKLSLRKQISQDMCDMEQNVIFQAFPPNTTIRNGITIIAPAFVGCTIPVQNDTLTGTFIARAGALLAADAGAHHLLPTLPLAPKSEITAVGG